MKKINWSLITLSLLVIVSAGCSSVDKNAPLVPKDAALVVHLNTNALSSKLSWEEIKKSGWFMDMRNDQKDSLTRKILEDPGNSGMDTKDGFFVFARRTPDGLSYLGFTGHLKDANAFEAFNKKVSEAKEVVIKDNLKTILFEEKGSVSWNENKFLYLLKYGFSPSFRMDSNNVNQDPPKADFQDIAKRIFSYKKDSLLTGDDRFNTLLKDEGDVHFWSNAEGLFADNPSLGFLSLLKTEVYFRESVTAATLSFDKGKIAVHARTYSNKEMEELMKKYSGENINVNYIQRIPSENVIGLLAANYKPEGLKQFLKLGGLDGFVNSFLGEYKLTLDEMVAASKGDLLITVTNVGLRKKMISLGQGMDSLPITAPTADVLLVMSVKDKAPFEKLAGAVQKLSQSGQIPAGLTYKINNDLFVAGTNAAMIDQYLNGGNKNFPFLSRISGHPVAFYLDVNKLITTFNEKARDSSINGVYQASVDMWKDIIVTGGEFKNGAIVQDAEINLVDQNTNSLQQLNTYIEKLASTRKKPF